MKATTWALVLATAVWACGNGEDTTGPGCASNSAALAQCSGDFDGKVNLTVTVSGSSNAAEQMASAVEFYDNQNVRYFCYPGAPQASGACSADFAVGSQARIQRVLSLPNDDEFSWRLSQWGGACTLDANVEPRGGICVLTMNTDKNVTVSFERRVKVKVQHILADPMSVRWMMSHSPQRSGGNSSIRSGTFDCNSPSGLPYCVLDNMWFDRGTVLTLTAGTGNGTPANWTGWAGACPGVAKDPVCVLTLTSDVTIFGNWRFQ